MNEMKQPQNSIRHEICVKDRRTMSISGVKEMISFDEQMVSMLTVCGELSVAGESLHVKVLDVDRGQVVIEGRIDDVDYVDNQPAETKGFWARLLR